RRPWRSSFSPDGCRQFLIRLGLQWQADAETCSRLANVVEAENLTLMLAHNPITNAEPQASSLPHFLGSKKRIKDALWETDAFAVIGKCNFRPIAGHPGLDLNPACASGIAHRIISIIQNIEKYLLDLMRVGYQFRQAFIELFNDFNSVAGEIIGTQRNGLAQH